MNASTTITITRDDVAAAMRAVGYGHYSNYAATLADDLNRGGVNANTVLTFATRNGVGGRVSNSEATAFINALRLQTEVATEAVDVPVEVVSEADWFADFKANASEVIRAFISDDSDHDGGEYDESEVTALLILAGLEDAPEPEPEVVAEETTVDAGMFQRLVAFARRHGFTG
jgi:hypothetical protein